MFKSRLALAALLGACMYRAAEPGVTGTGAPPLPTKTPEQLAQEAAQAAQAKADAKAAKDKEKADKVAAEKLAKAQAKEVAAKAKADKKAADDAAKQAAKDAKAAASGNKEAEKAAKLKAKEDAKAAREAAKLANQMPEQNGVRRPKPATLCGQAWAVFDELSASKGSPVSIGESLAVTTPKGLVEGNVKAEYARWRKFFGITGRVAPVAAAPAAGAPVPPLPGATA